MWKRKTVAVVFPTTRIKSSIKKSILEFDSTGYVDEIIVVDNNPLRDFENEASEIKVNYIKEKRKGHGLAIKTGLNKSKADILIVAEPDGTFDGKDITKLLAYTEDFDVVFGSRTHVPLIESGSGMTFLRRIINVFYGKMITYLNLCSPITDPGCILRATTRESWRKISPRLNSKGDSFITEWLLLVAKKRLKFIDIPINFKAKQDRSYLDTNIFYQALWALVILFQIIRIWVLD